MKCGERDVSVYEIMLGGGRWYWDVNYIPEADLEDREPLPPALLTEIDSALEERVFLSRTEIRTKPLDKHISISI